MTLVQAVTLFLAALMAGALNSVAGGGSFISFPAIYLSFPNIPNIPIRANATNTVALWPGTLASVSAYRRELSAQRRVLVPMVGVSLLGGLTGALLLLRTPANIFAQMVPFLMLFATLLFTFSKRITTWLRSVRNHDVDGPTTTTHSISLPLHPEASTLTLLVVMLLQLGTAIYGGFFGGGIGIIMLAILSLLGMENIHEMNALKTLLATFINGVAVVTFVIAGTVLWPQAVLMIVGAVLGGYGGAFFARQIDPQLVRRFVIVVGFVLTVYFFYRTFLQ
jgi:uncharacterized membrane protein YfcA